MTAFTANSTVAQFDEYTMDCGSRVAPSEMNDLANDGTLVPCRLALGTSRGAELTFLQHDDNQNETPEQGR